MGLLFEVCKLFVCMNSSVLDSYCVVDRITREFPLSALVTIAPFSVSFVFMLLMALGSGCVLRVCVCVCVCCSFVACCCVLLPVFCIPPVLKGGGMKWQFQPPGRGFGSSSGVCYADCIWVLSVARSFPAQKKLYQSCSPLWGRFVFGWGRGVCLLLG